MPRIPKFKDEAEEARYWDIHDSAPLISQWTEAHNVQFPSPKHKSVVIDIEPRYIDAIKKIARRRHLPYHTLMGRWLKERVPIETR